jgi:hypothetical protein
MEYDKFEHIVLCIFEHKVLLPPGVESGAQFDFFLGGRSFWSMVCCCTRPFPMNKL